MKPSLVRGACTLAAILALTTSAWAQSSSATLTGIVVDAAGGVVPGATVIVKNAATSVQSETVTNTSGAFSVPALEPGTYTVTVSLTGFKTAVVADVRLLASRQTEIKATLEIGGVNETVEVSSRAELIQTQATSVQNTITAEQINNLPLVSRNTLYFTTFLPGVETQLGPRQSTIMGLPQNTINITIDGVSNSNNFQSGDGFFSMVTPRTDAVEEITVTGATPGANAAGNGAVNIAFVTRSGTNQLSGSAYEYFRHPTLNSNYYFNKVNGLERNEVIVHQYGGRVGGPIAIPGLFDGRGRAFFFFNMEHLHQPSEATRTRTVLNPQAQNGIYTYVAGGVRRSVNMLALAAAQSTPQTSTRDPNVVSVLNQINAAMATTGTLSTPDNSLNTDRYVFQSPSRGNQYAPTTRVDFNLTSNHRLTGTYYWQRFLSKPDLLNNVDPQFPDFPNYAYQTSYRTTGSVGLRSTLGGNLVNEIKGGWQWSPNNFFGNITSDMFDNQGGHSLGFAGGPNNTDFSNLSGVTATRNYAPRNTPNWSIDNTVSWIKGTHSLSFGGSFGQIIHDQNTADVAPAITFGLDTNNDPARNMFNTTNFPSASANQLSMARHLYALVTGRITAINGTARLSADTGEYVYLGALNQKARMSDLGLFVQDSWRMKPTLTLNYGLRWELQFPFTPITHTWSTATMADVCGVSGEGNGVGDRQCNLFQPGTFGNPGAVPQYVKYEPGSQGFDTDYNNLAPNLGVAWRPNVQGEGWLRKFLGDPEQATIRGGYSITFNRERMDRFTGLYGGNVGGSTNASNRNNGNANLIPDSRGWPLLYREKDRLGPPSFPLSPNYPIIASITAGNDINIFDPNVETPWTQSWMVGFQRALGQNTAIEVRYVGNRNEKAWTTENWNTPNIFENGFLDEFKRAQANLAANVRSGDPSRAGSFAYFGPGTGTQPLPIYLGYLLGLPASQAGVAANYSGTQWTNSTWVDQLGEYEPSPRGQATSLWTGNSGTWRANAARAGIASNYFVLNPAVDQSNVTRSAAGSKYHSLQIDLRRRLANGFTVQGNYTFAQRWGSSLEDLHRDRIFLETDNVPHAFKLAWVYDIPVGRGRRFASDINPVVNAIIGNWEFSGTGRVQVRDFGVTNTRVVGMTEAELSEAFRIRVVRNPTTGTTTVFNLPDDIIENTRRAYNSDPTSPTGYPDGEAPTGRYLAPASVPGCISLFVSDCGTSEQVWVRGPWFTRFDLSFKKRFPMGGRVNFDLQFDLLNAFDNINFTPVFAPGGGNTIFQVTEAYRDINTTFDPGGRLGQLVFRLNF